MNVSTRSPVALGTSRRASRRLGLLLCLLVAAGIGLALLAWPFASHKPAADAGRGRSDAIPVLAAPATVQDVPIYLDGLGTVQAFNTVTVKTLVDGTLTEVRFKEGDTVHPGTVLALIDPRLYQAALDQTVAKKAQDAANLANARVDQARYAKLSATAYSSTQQYDTQKALVAQLEAQVAGDQAAIDTARTNLGYATITAPLEGRVGIRQVDPGNVVHASDTTGLVVLTQLQPISVVFTLPQQTLATITRAMRAGEVEILALNQGGDGAQAVVDRGTLTVLDNEVDPTTGTIKLKATFPNAAERLWPGGFVAVRVRVRIETGALTIPPAAVQRGPSGAYVYVIGADKTAARRMIGLGHEDETVSVVRTGLSAGDQVVTDGASRLNDGSLVTVVDEGAEPKSDGPQAPGSGGGTGGSHRRRNRQGGDATSG